MEPIDPQEAVSRAAKGAEAAPERYKDSAFATILQHLLGGSPSHESDVDGTDSVNNADSANPADPVQPHAKPEWRAEVADGIPEAHKVADSNKRTVQAMWAVITLWKREEPANSENIRIIIREKLGVSPEGPQNMSATLKSLVPKYLNRTKVGRGFEYEPLKRSLEVFGELASE